MSSEKDSSKMNGLERKIELLRIGYEAGQEGLPLERLEQTLREANKARPAGRIGGKE